MMAEHSINPPTHSPNEPFTKDFRAGGRLWVYPNFWKRHFGGAQNLLTC
jgi:hypothetical protein